ncbi:MAG: PAS domain S-box protein, partial [Deltaproteobacteria bacterium]|nr:PAS domain S-box protein [Deltaproteobacteria bacterium]
MYDSSLKVLLIEDNPGDARLICETLKKTNTARYEMKWVDRLSPGLMQLDREPIDVVLLDLSLPDSHGLETLERTLSQSKEVPIVVLTGLNDEELAINALRNGAQDYLNKSDVNSTLLGRSIRHAIERKRAELALQRAHDTLEERVRERTDAFVKQNKKLLIEIEERRHAENLYQTLAEKSMAGVYIVQDKIFRYLNSNAAAYAGYTPEKLVGEEALCIVHPEDRKWVKLRARQMLKGEREAPYEFRIQTRDGRERWILETVTSTFYEGRPAILGNSMDVTNMKKADENVRESHQLLSNIISFLPDATLIIDQNSKVLTWNRAMEELTGVEAEDMVGLDNYEYSIPFYGERRSILIDLALNADSDMENKYSFIRKEKDLLVAETDAPCVRGENRILWGKAAPIRNTNGEIVGAIETIRDTTKRKQMEDALRESEIKYRELVQSANSIIYRRDTEGNVTFFNEYAQGFFGYSEDEILGKNVVGTLVPEVDSAGNDLTAMIADISAAPDRYVINENENMRSDGERVWIAWTNKALRDENGAIQEILCIGTDMTERRVMQGKLQESENWYRTLFETTGAGTVIIDEDTTLSLVNNEFETMTGYRKKELIGESWTKVIAGDDLERMKQYHDMRRTDPKAVPSNYECTLVDRHGAEKNILINVSMIPGTKKSIASFLDITEQRRLARELQESLREYRLLANNVSDII